MDNRLIELETRLAFQDQTLQELNNVVVRQQSEIAGLIRDIENLKIQLRTLAPEMAANRSDEIPPHY